MVDSPTSVQPPIPDVPVRQKPVTQGTSQEGKGTRLSRESSGGSSKKQGSEKKGKASKKVKKEKSKKGKET